MARFRLLLSAGVVLLSAAQGWCLVLPAPYPARDAHELAARIDRALADGWRKNGITPARRAADAEFLRRVYLDLAGRVPPVTEVRLFLDDSSPDKRDRLIERLLNGPHYANHLTNVYRALLLPEANSSLQASFQVPQFESWLRRHFLENTPYDEIVRELLTVPVGNDQRRRPARPARGRNVPLAFYFAKELKPENLAGSSARLFLGIKIECAECHNHPFAEWKREQFWGYAAFFAEIQRQVQGDFVSAGPERTGRRSLTIPGTEKVVQASFPDGTAPKWQADSSTREALADWMTRPDNPYFARAAANRLWAHFFGSGLINPVDEIAGGSALARSASEASNLEVLDALAQGFARHRFDVKFLIRAITATHAYQLTSAGAPAAAESAPRFARMAVKGLTAEQLFDCLAEATGFRSTGPEGPYYRPRSPRTEFLARFRNETDRPTEVQTSILQALTLMNGRVIADATSLERSETLAALLDAPFLDTASRIETLYLAAFARRPRAAESSRLVKFIADARAAQRGASQAENDTIEREALADVFWALLNSSEFFLNH